METCNHSHPLKNTCRLMGLRPAMADLPYPPNQVKEQNIAYANLLSIDYCGSVSELSAITQYINNETRLSSQKCEIAQTILSIAMAEMMHLQKLGELIVLSGGVLDFTAKYRNNGRRMWTPEYLTLPQQAQQMLQNDIEAEQAAIRQYEMHIQMINDPFITAVLSRIIQDEAYHIMLMKALLKEL